MTSGLDSQIFESYLPVYDAIPEEWEESRQFIVEHFKRISNAVNIREIGWYLDEELLSGKAFFPTSNTLSTGETSQQFRQILRKVIEFPGLSVGLNQQPHGINIDSNFTLIQLWGAATNAVALTGEPIPNGADTITYDSTNINITVASAYTRAYAIIEYLQEL